MENISSVIGKLSLKKAVLIKVLFFILVLTGCGQKPFSSTDFIPFDGEVHPNHQGYLLIAETFLSQVHKKETRVYCALGDSVSSCDARSFPLSYPGILSQKADFQKTRVLGIGGANTIQIRFEELPKVPEGADLVTLFAGLNDLVKTNLWGSPDALHPFGCGITEGTAYSYDFKKRIQIILNLLKKKKVRQVLIANLYDFTNGTGFKKWGWPDGLKILDQYNDRLAELAKENQIGLVDLHKAFSIHTERYFNNPRWDKPPRRWSRFDRPSSLPQKDQLRHGVLLHPHNGILPVLSSKGLSVFQRNT